MLGHLGEESRRLDRIAGAIVQVIVQLAPTLRDDEGHTLHPAAVGGLLAGFAVMFATGLLVTV